MNIIKEFPIGGRCWRVAIASDGQRVAFSSYYDLQVWDVDGTEPLWSQHFPDPTTCPSGLAFSPDGATLAMSYRKDLKLLDPDTGECRFDAPVGLKGSTVCYTKDGERLILGGHHIQVLTADGEPVLGPLGGPRSVADFSLSADETTLATAGEKSVWIYDLKTGELKFRYPVARFGASGVALSPDGGSAWAAQAGDIAICVRVGRKTKKVLAKAFTHGGQTEIIAHPDWRWVLVAAGEELFVFDPETGEQISKWVGGPRVDDMALSPDATRLMTAHLDGTARLWELPEMGAAQPSEP